MNKAVYGILAAAVLASIKSRDGGQNQSKSDLNSNIKSFLERKKIRMDAALATIYSFIDFSSTGEYEELSEVSNINIGLGYEIQQLVFMSLLNPMKIDSFCESVSEKMVKSFGSEASAARAWRKNHLALYQSFLDYFSQNDYGIAYNFIMSSIYPYQVNGDDWYKLFGGSKTDAFSLVQFTDEDDKEGINRKFLSAWIRSKIEPETAEPLLGGDLDIESIFKNVGTIFYFMATTEPIAKIPIKNYHARVIYNVLREKLSSNREFVDSSSADSFLMLDMTIQALVWIKEKLSSIKDEMGNQKYPEQSINTYEKMWQFWDDPTRVGSETMIFIEMEHYRKNQNVSAVPKQYKKDGGLLEKLWVSSQAGRGTPAWALTSWVLFYIYNGILNSNRIPSTLDWNQGFAIATNMFPSIKADLNKNVINRVKSISTLLERIESKNKSATADEIVRIIQEGSEDKRFDPPLKGFLSPSEDSISDYADLVKDKENEINIWSGKSGKKVEMLSYVAEYLGHCNTVHESSKVFSVYYKSVPFYTIEVTNEKKVVQIKGLGNRIMGSMLPANKISTNTVSEKNDLYYSDLNNLSLLLPFFVACGFSIPQSMYNKGNDLMLYTENQVAKNKVSKGLSADILSITH